MKKLPCENKDCVDVTFNIMPLAGGFIERSIMGCIEKINGVLSRGKYWDNLKVLDKLIHHLRELTSKLEQRRSELLKKKLETRN